MNQRITPQLANNEQTRQNTLLTADIPYHTKNSTAFTYTDARIDNLHTDDRLGTAAENNARTNIETEQQSGGDTTSQNPEHALETAPNLANTTNTTQPMPAHHPPKKRARITNIRFTPPSRDSPTWLPEASMPYTGDYRGCCWNAQALFASNIEKQNEKQNFAWDMLRDNDFGGLLETLGTTDTAEAARLPRNHRFF